MSKIRDIMKNKPWSLVFVGSILMWVIMGIVSNKFSVTALISNAYAASFIALAAFGQMLVITSGRGAIDLSIPGVVTLAAYISMGVINNNNAMFPVALVLVIALGIVVGVINSIGVIYLKIPSIIMTMAMNYILVTATLIYNRGFTVFDVCGILTWFTRTKIFGVIPIMILFVIAVGILIFFIMKKTTFGKSLSAMGQNYEAARFAGVKMVKVEMLAYVFSGILAAITGMLLSARNGGAFLNMGDNYMLETVAAVVVGGTAVGGGKCDVVGTLLGSLFLGLTVTVMQLAGASVGYQNIAKGLIIVVVLTLSMVSGSKKVKIEKKDQTITKEV